MLTPRSLVNAVARHQLPAAPDEVTPTFAIAFVDFTKAYDIISWEALWEVLNSYGVHPHRSSTLKAGLRQGCVLAPMLLSFFVGHILQEALSTLPPDKQFGVQIVTKTGGALPTDLIFRIVALVCAAGLDLQPTAWKDRARGAAHAARPRGR
eukprot:363518-Chlamydomonas_euryale.AAC.10